MEGAGVGAPAAGGEEGVAAGGLTEGVVGGAAGAAGEGCDTPGVAGVAGVACCAALLTIVKGAQAISTKIASRPWAKALEIMTRPFWLELCGSDCRHYETNLAWRQDAPANIRLRRRLTPASVLSI